MATAQTTQTALDAPKSTEVAPATRFNQFVDRVTTQVIAGLPLTVPDEDLKRARARYRVAFSADAQGALLECTPESVARAIVLSALSGLMPGGPRPAVWLIPRRNKHKGNAMECNWQMSFRGYIQLARRAGWELEPVLVFEGEKFEVREGDQPGLTHVRNLDLPKTWDALRYAYIRVYPEGKREQARYAYLTKDEIKKRRGKAQDQSIWNEWPLEMTYKTMCHYAGAREMFPTDDPTRHVLAAAEQAEIGSGQASTETWPAGGSKTERLAARLAAKPEPGGGIEISPQREGMPIDLAGAGEISDQEESGERPEPPAGETLSATQLKEVLALVDRSGVSLDAVEGEFGGRLDQAVIPGVDAKALEAQIAEYVCELAAKDREGGSEAAPDGAPGLFDAKKGKK